MLHCSRSSRATVRLRFDSGSRGTLPLSPQKSADGTRLVGRAHLPSLAMLQFAARPWFRQDPLSKNFKKIADAATPVAQALMASLHDLPSGFGAE